MIADLDMIVYIESASTTTTRKPHQSVLFIDSFATIMWMELADNYCEVLESKLCMLLYLYGSVTDALFQRNKVLFLRLHFKPKSDDNNYKYLPLLCIGKV
jgi:hypothetical protein